MPNGITCLRVPSKFIELSDVLITDFAEFVSTVTEQFAEHRYVFAPYLRAIFDRDLPLVDSGDASITVVTDVEAPRPDDVPVPSNGQRATRRAYVPAFMANGTRLAKFRYNVSTTVYNAMFPMAIGNYNREEVMRWFTIIWRSYRVLPGHLKTGNNVRQTGTNPPVPRIYADTEDHLWTTVNGLLNRLDRQPPPVAGIRPYFPPLLQNNTDTNQKTGAGN